MVSIQELSLVTFFTLAFSSFGFVAACPGTSQAKMKVCIATFSTANLLNLKERKNLIDAGNKSCPTDILKDSCTSFGVMMKCVNLGGFPVTCEGEFNKELKNQDILCTDLELGALCKDAPKLGGATSVVVSVSLIVASLAVTIFGRL